MAEFQQPPQWNPGDLVTSEKLNIYSNNDLYFKERLDSLGAGVFKKVVDITLDTNTNPIVVDLTTTIGKLKVGKLYHCFLYGKWYEAGAGSIRIFFNNYDSIDYYSKTYIRYAWGNLEVRSEKDSDICNYQEQKSFFIPFRIFTQYDVRYHTFVYVDFHTMGFYYQPEYGPMIYSAIIWFSQSEEIHTIKLWSDGPTFGRGTKFTIWETELI